ncbi:MAG: hypothetical protein AAFY29_17305 [Pseudomonadota bacterium]
MQTHQPSLEERVIKEVDDCLAAFGEWISGSGADDFARSIGGRLSTDGTYVSRTGSVQSLGELAVEVKAARGSNPDYRVSSGTVRIVDSQSHCIVVLYEERTRGSRLGPIAEFTRMVTAVLHEDADAVGGFRWKHIHESQRDG